MATYGIYRNRQWYDEIYYDGHWIDQVYIGKELVWERNRYKGFQFEFSGDISFIASGSFVIDTTAGYHVEIKGADNEKIDIPNNGISIATITEGITYIRFMHGKAMANYTSLLRILTKFPKSMEGVKNLSDLCYNCVNLSSIPEDLFSNCINLESIECGFSGCNLQEIPAALFKNNTNIKNFALGFRFNKMIEEIPSGLFEPCTNVEDFTQTFAGCYKLKKIPENLFENCKQVRNFQQTFEYCSNLQYLPYTLFNNCKNVNNFISTFKNCIEMGGNAPPLWNWPYIGVFDGHSCFANCTKLGNYNEIPTDWK